MFVLPIAWLVSYTSFGMELAAHTEVIGDAGPEADWLALVHGNSQDRRVFSAQVNDFKSRFRILLIDLPGHGLSANMPGPFGHGELASGVAEAMEAAGVSKTHYWGTHTGAALGLLLASRNAQQFQSLILEGAVLPGRAMAIVVEEIERARRTALAEGMAAARRKWFEAGWFDVIREHPQQCRAAEHWLIVSEFTGRTWLESDSAAHVAPIEGILKSLQTPVLLYNGEHDLQEFVQVADQLEALLPNVQRMRIPDAGGFPAWEYPARVNAIVADFLPR